MSFCNILKIYIRIPAQIKLLNFILTLKKQNVTFPLCKGNVCERKALYVPICGLLARPEWITSLSLNKASLLFVVYNEQGM